MSYEAKLRVELDLYGAIDSPNCRGLPLSWWSPLWPAAGLFLITLTKLSKLFEAYTKRQAQKRLMSGETNNELACYTASSRILDFKRGSIVSISGLKQQHEGLSRRAGRVPSQSELGNSVQEPAILVDTIKDECRRVVR